MNIKFHNIGRSVIFAILLLALLQPIVAVMDECPDDDIETDDGWVCKDSITLAWSMEHEFEVDGAVYTIRACDFDRVLNASFISIEKDGVTRKTFLYLDAGTLDNDALHGDNWFNWGSGMGMELTGITIDAYETPSVHLDLYCLGKPQLDIGIDAIPEISTSGTSDEVDVSSDQYVPGGEETITIDVKNTGDGWIEDVVVRIDIGKLKLVDNGFEFRDQNIYESLGCIEEGATRSINFTAAVPAWDGVTSPYQINYTISASAEGADILKRRYYANESINLSCTEPQLLVTQSVCPDEINVGRCNPLRSDIGQCSSSGADMTLNETGALAYNVREWSVVEVGIYNLGFYPLHNLNITDFPIPDGFRVAEIYEEGSLECVSKDHPYHIGYKIVPTKTGVHLFNTTVVGADFYGTKHSWSSDGGTIITVHGPQINLTKTVTESGNGTYMVTLNARNEGDRAALIDLTDTIPLCARCTESDAENGTDAPIRWDSDLRKMVDDSTIFRSPTVGVFDHFDLHRISDSYFLIVNDVLLEPEQSLGFSYYVPPDCELNLSRAEVWFTARNGYDGEIFSSIIGLPVAAQDDTDDNVTSGNVTSGNWSNQSDILTADASTSDLKNESDLGNGTEVLPANASDQDFDQKEKSKGRNLFDLLKYLVIGTAILAAAFLLYRRITEKEKKMDERSSWVISYIKKTGSEHEITVNKNGKKRTIKLNEKLYKKLIKDKKLTFGKQTILIRSKKR
jgi:hypothetical protein